MANEDKNMPPQADYEQQIFNDYLAQSGHDGPQIDLPTPVPASEWLHREAVVDGREDAKLLELLEKKEAVENGRVEGLERVLTVSGVIVKQVFDERAKEMRFPRRTSLNSEIHNRRKELRGEP